jgi:hypothetical protein
MHAIKVINVFLGVLFMTIFDICAYVPTYEVLIIMLYLCRIRHWMRSTTIVLAANHRVVDMHVGGARLTGLDHDDHFFTRSILKMVMTIEGPKCDN